jgi:hypothetical protein
MPWFTFTRNSAESPTVVDNIRANYETFVQRPDWPQETAAAFFRHDRISGQTHFYISPAFAEAEPFMVTLYSARQCPPPKRKVRPALLVGKMDALELLKD